MLLGFRFSLDALNDPETRAVIFKEGNVECTSHRWGIEKTAQINMD